jgi:pseudooxynicotine dehydrogenase
MDLESNHKKHSSRREFLAAAGAAGATGIASAALGVELPAAKSRPGSETDYDVIVVGGGFAGVAAARDCQKYGLKTLLLEARNRLGGRTYDTQWNGHHIEMGGTWVHWGQPYTWSEIERYGLEVIQTPGADPDRIIARADNYFLDTPYSKVAAEITDAGDRYFADARAVWERPWDTHFTWDKLVAQDRLTTADRLAQMKLTKLQKAVLEATLEVCTHSRVDKGSYLEIARWYALGGYHWVGLSDSIERYQIKQGTGELIRRMMADGRADAQMSSPVRRIEQHDGIVKVSTTTAKTYSSKALILGVPMNCLVNIECDPALSSGKLEASRERHSANGIKFYAEVKGRLGKAALLAPYNYGAGYTFTYKEMPDSTVLVGFGSNPEAFDANDEEAMQTTLRQFIPNVEVTACTSYSWARDPFSLGTYCSYRPGKLTQWFDTLRAQEGHIYMAGSDVSEGWRGFIDGAIASGVRSAAQVAKDLIA